MDDEQLDSVIGILLVELRRRQLATVIALSTIPPSSKDDDRPRILKYTSRIRSVNFLLHQIRTFGEITQAHHMAGYPDTIHRFSFFPYRGPECPPTQAVARAWPYTIADLASQAEHEDWTGSNIGATNRILENYILYTYQRLVIESKISISQDGIFATFNTGLLTQHGEEIFAHFEKNHRKKLQPWIFQSWVTESNMRLMDQFADLPEMAEYVATPADLVFDMTRNLTLNIEHIVANNLGRFPSNFQNENMARITLNHASTMALKRLRRNYKLAIPQWYPALGAAGAQLLLPLDLDQTGTADLALVVGRTEGGGYRGNTVLTLDMAYSNARLVARPNSDWLRP